MESHEIVYAIKSMSIPLIFFLHYTYDTLCDNVRNIVVQRVRMCAARGVELCWRAIKHVKTILEIYIQNSIRVNLTTLQFHLSLPQSISIRPTDDLDLYLFHAIISIHNQPNIERHRRSLYVQAIL